MASSKVRKEILSYINSKLAKLKKQEKILYISSTFIRITVVILNLIIIGLASFAIYQQIHWYNTDLKINKPDQSFLDAAGLTVVLASVIVLTFIINMALTIFSAVMKWQDYKQAIREIEYITIKVENESEKYSLAEFEADLKNIEEVYLAKKKVSKKALFIKAIMGGK
ncbi:hypothetical protein ACW95P_00565 [Candidatus Mycoplasma pogonae]